MRVAVLGHVEWVRFVRVDGPPGPGAILHGAPGWDEPAGGGGVAAAELARLAGSCALHTALGDDANGRSVRESLGRHGVIVVGPTRSGPHRRGVALLQPDGERTIVVEGDAQAARGADLPPDAFHGVDGVYVCKGDAGAVQRARDARIVVATARMLPVLREAGIRIDALVHSGRDPGEAYVDGDLPVPPVLVARTDGARGGTWRTAEASGTWDAAPLPGPARDAYGAGDCFAAGLTFALASGMAPDRAVRFAATRGALACCRDGGLGGASGPAV